MPRPEPPFHIPQVVFLFHVLPFIVELFALANPDLNLYLAILKVKLQGKERQAPFLRFAIETSDLPFVQQQFSHPQPFRDMNATGNVALRFKWR